MVVVPFHEELMVCCPPWPLLRESRPSPWPVGPPFAGSGGEAAAAPHPVPRLHGKCVGTGRASPKVGASLHE